jgi:hypothetical protein
MVDSPTKIYKDYVRANLPNGMSYDTGTNRYDINNHSFFSYNNSNWYYQYISKYGYSALSAYAANGFDPALVFDFKGDYFRKSATTSTFGASITHAATTNATMVDSDGLLKWRPHNNITKSNTFSTWTKNFSAIVDNAAVGPNGVANTASVVTFPNTTSNLYNLSTASVSVGNKVTLAAWVRSDTITSLTFAINGRTNAANNTPEANLAVTSTWALVSFEATVLGNDTGLFFMIGKSLASSPVSQIGDFEIYGAHMFRSDLGGMVNNPDAPTGFESYVPTTTAEAYAPRRGHHSYNGSSWVNEGILHESEARTNLLTYSNDLTGAAWLNSANSNTANAGVSPDGTSNANKVVPTTSSGSHYTYQTLNLPSARHSVSVYVASAGYGFATISVGVSGTNNYYAVVIDLSDGTQTALYSAGVQSKTATVEPVGSFYRVSISGDGEKYLIVGASDTGTYTPSAYGFKSFQGDGTSGILVYGAQAEAGTLSSYIPTGSATVTRAAETLTVPAANLPYSSTNMSIQMDGKMTYADTGGDNGKMFSWNLSNADNIYSMLSTFSARTGTIYWVQSASGVLDSLIGPDTSYSPDTNVPFNFASRHGSTFLNGAIDGTALTANTTPTALPNLSSTDLNLGYGFMGTIGQFRMWSEDLTDVGIAEAST